VACLQQQRPTSATSSHGKEFLLLLQQLHLVLLQCSCSTSMSMRSSSLTCLVLRSMLALHHLVHTLRLGLCMACLLGITTLLVLQLHTQAGQQQLGTLLQAFACLLGLSMMRHTACHPVLPVQLLAPPCVCLLAASPMLWCCRRLDIKVLVVLQLRTQAGVQVTRLLVCMLLPLQLAMKLAALCSCSQRWGTMQATMTKTCRNC
jgi:hypothetical protein